MDKNNMAFYQILKHISIYWLSWYCKSCFTALWYIVYILATGYIVIYVITLKLIQYHQACSHFYNIVSILIPESSDFSTRIYIFKLGILYFSTTPAQIIFSNYRHKLCQITCLGFSKPSFVWTWCHIYVFKSCLSHVSLI